MQPVLNYLLSLPLSPYYLVGMTDVNFKIKEFFIPPSAEREERLTEGKADSILLVSAVS
jgi:hypothetical protein